jgi:hypothetical protein
MSKFGSRYRDAVVLAAPRLQSLDGKNVENNEHLFLVEREKRGGAVGKFLKTVN